MTTARLLPIINAAGCAVLVAFIVIQWVKGSHLNDELTATKSNLILETNAKSELEFRAMKLQQDIDGLKASIDSIRQQAEENEKDLATKATEVETLNAGLLTAQENARAWEEAIKLRDEAIAKRDEKITELNSSLVATRKRLDEAIAQLKKAGAR